MVVFRLFMAPVTPTKAEILVVVFDDAAVDRGFDDGFGNALSDEPSSEGACLHFPDDRDPYDFWVEGAEAGGCEDEVRVWASGWEERFDGGREDELSGGGRKEDGKTYDDVDGCVELSTSMDAGLSWEGNCIEVITVEEEKSTWLEVPSSSSPPLSSVNGWEGACMVPLWANWPFAIDFSKMACNFSYSGNGVSRSVRQCLFFSEG
jgi:hypothetical protein